MLERYRHSILPAHYLQEALGQASQHVIETSPFFTPLFALLSTLAASLASATRAPKTNVEELALALR